MSEEGKRLSYEEIVEQLKPTIEKAAQHAEGSEEYNKYMKLIYSQITALSKKHNRSEDILSDRVVDYMILASQALYYSKQGPA